MPPLGLEFCNIDFLAQPRSATRPTALIKLTERYCVVYQTLRTPATLALSVRTTV